MKKNILIISNDKIGRKALTRIREADIDLSNFCVLVDKSSTVFRILRLWALKRISISSLKKMFFADLKRKDFDKINESHEIYSNKDLHRIIESEKPSKVLMFRAGLIIDKANLSGNVMFMNIHCADIPDFSGLCAIERALRENSLKQRACLHVVTQTIDDSSQILDFEPYLLNPESSYFENEEIAYNAGIELLIRCMRDVE